MKVLLIGGGGREHALGWKIAQSPQLSKLYVDPANPGLNHIGAPVAIDFASPRDVVSVAKDKNVDLVVVGPEAPLAAGVGDALREAGVACFGPDRAAAMLETSKAFMKDVCASVGAPTAAYEKFTDAERARAFLRAQTPPYVIKADGLAAGKGVVIANTLEDAEASVAAMLDGRFGSAGAQIVIEEYMEGEEASFFVLTDGRAVLPLMAAQDHKRAFDGDAGPNTGGMGAYAPAPIFDDAVRERALSEIIRPVIAEMARRGTPYVGVLYAGLMVKDGAPRLVEINARFGDPECQVLMRLLKSDLLPALHGAATGALAGHGLDWSQEACALVVMAANGYPGAYQKGTPIDGVERANARDGVVVFHAGTAQDGPVLRAAGGRVLNVTATGADVAEAVQRAYSGVDAIDWPDGFFRRDIGWRAIGARP